MNSAKAALHYHGECIPCRYLRRPGGCQRGDECKFCHLCTETLGWQGTIRRPAITHLGLGGSRQGCSSGCLLLLLFHVYWTNQRTTICADKGKGQFVGFPYRSSLRGLVGSGGREPQDLGDRDLKHRVASSRRPPVWFGGRASVCLGGVWLTTPPVTGHQIGRKGEPKREDGRWKTKGSTFRSPFWSCLRPVHWGDHLDDLKARSLWDTTCLQWDSPGNEDHRRS